MPNELVSAIINAEETAREQDIVLKKRFKKFRTHVIDWKDSIYDVGSHTFLSKTGEGTLEELIIVAPNSNFSLFVEVDGVMAYQGSFSRFQEISIHVGSIIAKQRGSLYILQMDNIVFLNSIRVLLDVGILTTFSRLYCKYKLEGLVDA